MSTRGEELPSAMHVLWLAQSREANGDNIQAYLRRILERTIIKIPGLVGDVLAVYLNNQKVGSDMHLQALCSLRKDYIKRSINWVDFCPSISSAACTRMSRVLKGISRTSPYSGYGDRYMAVNLMLLCEPWRSAITPRHLPPYREVAIEYGDETNDNVRPYLETAIKTVVSDYCLVSGPITPRIIAAACATLSELCTKHGPEMYTNCAIAEAIGTSFPAVCFMSDEFACEIGASNTIGIIVDHTMYVCNDCTVAEFMITWLSEATGCGAPVDPSVVELAALVVDGVANSIANRAGFEPSSAERGIESVV